MYSVLILFSVNCFILKLHGFVAKLMDYGTDMGSVFVWVSGCLFW